MNCGGTLGPCLKDLHGGRFSPSGESLACRIEFSVVFFYSRGSRKGWRVGCHGWKLKSLVPGGGLEVGLGSVRIKNPPWKHGGAWGTSESYGEISVYK